MKEVFTFIKSIPGHTSFIYALAFSKDSTKFASGSADKKVIVWDSTGKGIKQYDHSTAVQCLSFNPILPILASGSGAEFGLWTFEEKKCRKIQTQAKCQCCDWSPDGQILAIGLKTGIVMIVDKQGETLGQITRNATIWTLQFNPVKYDSSDNVLAIGCGDQTLSFEKINGGNNFTPVSSERKLGFNPLTISFFSDGDFLVLGGSDNNLYLYTKEGILIGLLAKHNSWVWASAVMPKRNLVLSGSNDGNLKMMHVTFSVVHGLYKDRYAHRELMTDVIIQHLVTDMRVKIHCRDYIRKISLYKDKLAVLLSDKIVIYSVDPEDPDDMKYKIACKIPKKLDCNSLVATSKNILLCNERQLSLLNLKGETEREWNMESVVRYLRVVGGPPGKETLLVGLKNGDVLKLFVDNAFPILLIKHGNPIRCLDISIDFLKLAIVDEVGEEGRKTTNLAIYNLETQDQIYTEAKVSSVAWNSEMDDMLAYSGENTLSIKTTDFPSTQQRIQGFVVGFKNSKIFALNTAAMNTIDVPQSATMYKYIVKQSFSKAYEIACLGVTENDWRSLGVEALQSKEFEISRKSFWKIKDLKFIDLVEKIERNVKNPNYSDACIQAEIAAYMGKFKQAASIYEKNNLISQAIQLYSEMKKWEEAKLLIEKEMKSKLKTDQLKNVQDMSYQLLYSQAEWARENGDWKASADLFVLVKDYKKAIEIYGTKGMLEPLYEICKSLDKTKNADAIEKCAKYFKQHKHHSYAKEAYLRLGDLKGLMNLHLELQKWNEAFLLAKQNPDLAVDIYVPYAEYLLSQDKYNEAQKAYIKANKPDLALKIIITLKENAIIQKKYKDASYYYWEMVLSCLKVVSDAKKPSQKDREYLLKSEEYKRMSHIYFAYDLVYLYATQPFEKFTLGDAYLPAVFNAACFLANIIGKDVPKNISLFNIYYAIASIGCSQENFKTARIAYDRLQGMKMPLRLQAKVETECLKIKAKPFSDSSNNICNRCLSHNALLSPIGDKCSVCGHPFIRSMISFETLPIVEFEISENITHEQALDLLKIDAAKPKAKKKDGWEETKAENQQTLSLVNSPPQEVDDLFFKHIKENAEYNMDPENYKPVQVNEKILTFMNFEEVFISSFKAYCTTYPYKYYRNMVSDIPLSICDRCCKIFMQDEYEFACLETNGCPYCRYSLIKTEEELDQQS